MNKENKMVDIKITEKEEKAVAMIVAFMQGLKDCEDKEKYLLDNALAARMVLSFGKTNPNDAHAVLSAYVINNLIPYLAAKKEDSIDKIAEEFDKKTDEMMKEMVVKLSKDQEQNSEE